MVSFGARLRDRFRGNVRLAGVAGLALTSLSGGFFFYNANILNTYRTRTTAEKARVAYEQRWRPLERLHPRRSSPPASSWTSSPRRSARASARATPS